MRIPQILATSFERLDGEVRDHSVRVCAYSRVLARTIGVSVAQISIVAMAARFHEIGKLKIPEAIVYKPAKLTADELATFREYPLRGYETVRQEQSFAEVAEIVYSHRERFDGKGDPRRLMGKAIPLGARIVAVADAFDDSSPINHTVRNTPSIMHEPRCYVGLELALVLKWCRVSAKYKARFGRVCDGHLKRHKLRRKFTILENISDHKKNASIMQLADGSWNAVAID